MPKTPPAELLRRKDLTLEDLVREAERLLTEIAPQQTRYLVAERPDARTVRYYISQRLLPSPVGYEGGRARYSGSHLLRLLLIKKLQTEHHTLRQIRTLLAADDTALQGRLWSADGAPASSAASSGGDTTRSAASSGSGTTRFGAVALRRFALPAGGSADLPQQLLEDADGRRRLAEALEALAGRLRASDELEAS